MAWIRFPNGKVWLVGENGWFSGTAEVPSVEDLDGLEAKMDAIAEAATGSTVGLTDFAYKFIGNDKVSFSGVANGWLEWVNSDEEDREAGEYLTLEEGPELVRLLSEQYGVNEACAQHAIESIGTAYENEVGLTLLESGREVRFPAHPQECDYVRIVMDDLELGYWSSDEFRDAPGEVLGAILGGMAGGQARTLTGVGG